MTAAVLCLHCETYARETCAVHGPDYWREIADAGGVDDSPGDGARELECLDDLLSEFGGES
jgi:hypothetical protein